MTPLAGTDRRLLLFRGNDMPALSEREKSMLALARPHIAELHTRRDRELRGDPNLTPRQWECSARWPSPTSVTADPFDGYPKRSRRPWIVSISATVLSSR
jgi:hypothetical protein